MYEENKTSKYWSRALLLVWLTIAYDLAEGLFSVYFASRGGTLTLLGFGIDSFVEVMSGIGILVMVLRIRREPESDQPRSERIALRVTGWAFFLFAGGLGAAAVSNLVDGHKPDATVPAIVVSVISGIVMWGLVYGKRKIGRALNSAAILADANCSLICLYMSLVLLASSLVFRFTGFAFVDTLGVMALIYFSVGEGREALEEARGQWDTDE